MWKRDGLTAIVTTPKDRSVNLNHGQRTTHNRASVLRGVRRDHRSRHRGHLKNPLAEAGWQDYLPSKTHDNDSPKATERTQTARKAKVKRGSTPEQDNRQTRARASGAGHGRCEHSREHRHQCRRTRCRKSVLATAGVNLVAECVASASEFPEMSPFIDP
jgi:hypothetical protein